MAWGLGFRCLESRVLGLRGGQLKRRMPAARLRATTFQLMWVVAARTQT